MKVEKSNKKVSILGFIFVRLPQKIIFVQKKKHFWVNWPHSAINLNDIGKYGQLTTQTKRIKLISWHDV